MSDAAVAIPLPETGGPLTTSLGHVINSPLALGSLSGLTVYKTPPQPAAFEEARLP